jgi:hypothetical protein
MVGDCVIAGMGAITASSHGEKCVLRSSNLLPEAINLTCKSEWHWEMGISLVTVFCACFRINVFFSGRMAFFF